MTMDVESRDENGVVVVNLRGKLDTNTTPSAEDSISALCDRGATKMLINLAELDYISSAGLRLLLATAKKLKASGGELRVCSLNNTVQEVFDISGFGSILNVQVTEVDGLANF